MAGKKPNSGTSKDMRLKANKMPKVMPKVMPKAMPKHK